MSNLVCKTNKRLLVGKINGLFGVNGWIKVFSHTNPRKNILSCQLWHVKAGDDWQVLSVISGREQGKTLIAQIKNITTPEQAKTLLGHEIYIKKSQLPKLKKNQYYWQDLIGLSVINKQNITLGKVSGLVDTGANTVLVINGKQEHWVPYIEPFLIKVDIDQQQILIDWDENF